jgi:hypothetical protein
MRFRVPYWRDRSKISRTAEQHDAGWQFRGYGGGDGKHGFRAGLVTIDVPADQA